MCLIWPYPLNGLGGWPLKPVMWVRSSLGSPNARRFSDLDASLRENQTRKCYREKYWLLLCVTGNKHETIVVWYYETERVVKRTGFLEAFSLIMLPSTSGLSRRPFTPESGVRIPLGVPLLAGGTDYHSWLITRRYRVRLPGFSNHNKDAHSNFFY